MKKEIYSTPIHTKCFSLKSALALLLLLILWAQTPLLAQSEKELFDGARLALFDRQWDQALAKLNQLTQQYPKTSYYAQAHFYKGKCFQEKREPLKALEYYQAFLTLSGNESLKEEAQIAIIDLNFSLYQAGKKGYMEKIIALLNSAQRSVQYYAAFKLSYTSDKNVANKAVPVLKQLAQNENDNALVDRAKIALMRINPQLVKELSSPQNLENASMYIRITEKKTRKVILNITIPFALARIALDAMSSEDKQKFQKDGYSIDSILKSLSGPNKFLKIDDQDEIVEIGIQ